MVKAAVASTFSSPLMLSCCSKLPVLDVSAIAPALSNFGPSYWCTLNMCSQRKGAMRSGARRAWASLQPFAWRSVSALSRVSPSSSHRCCHRSGGLEDAELQAVDLDPQIVALWGTIVGMEYVSAGREGRLRIVVVPSSPLFQLLSSSADCSPAIGVSHLYDSHRWTKEDTANRGKGDGRNQSQKANGERRA